MANNWQLALDLTNVTPFDPTRQNLPTGVYKVKILDADMGQSSDPTKPASVRFDLQVLEGEQRGLGTAVWLGTDLTKKGNVANWKTLLLSCGAPPQMADGKLTVAANTFVGKPAFVYIVAKPEGAGKDEFDQRNFVTPEQATKLAQMLASGMQPGAQAQATGFAQAQPQQAPAATPTPTGNGAVPQPQASGMGGLANAISGTGAPPAPTGGAATF